MISAIKKISPSPQVPVGDTSRSRIAFSKQFDNYYGILEQKIGLEYEKMRLRYITMYQENYVLNQEATA